MEPPSNDEQVLLAKLAPEPVLRPQNLLRQKALVWLFPPLRPPR